MIDLDILGHCADRYGVSLTAAVLKWLEHTDEKAVVIHSRDGFMKWSWSSQPAFKAGAFFKTRDNPIPIPAASLAGNSSVSQEEAGCVIVAKTWFRHAEDGMKHPL